MSESMLRSFETAGAVTVRVSVSSPDVEVTTWTQAVTEVELVPNRTDKATMDAIESMSVLCRPTSNGFEVVVEQQRRNFSFGFSRGPSLVVRVRCPEGAAVELNGASSDLFCTGTVSSLRSRTASGDIVADVVTGNVSADTASGDVKVHSCSSLSAKLVSGDVDVSEVTGNVEATTVSGDISIRSWSGDSARLQAVSGDVSLRVVPGRRVQFDVSSISGSARSSLDPIDGDPSAQSAPPADGAGGRAAVADIWIRTVSGDVRIDRAETARTGQR